MNKAKKISIAINTRHLLKGKMEGIGVFTFEIFSQLAKQHPEIEFIYLFDRAYDKQFITSENIIPVVLFPQARHPFLWHWWFQFSVKDFLKRRKPDLFISPDGFIPLRCIVPCIAVIHDLNFEYFPKFLPWLVRYYYRYYYPLFARKSTRIITVSNFSKKNIESAYAIHPGKTEVVYNAAAEQFKPCTDKEREDAIKKYSFGNPYFIYVGALNPRKNIGNLLRAFEKFKHSDENNFNLLIVGNPMFKAGEIKEIYHALQHKKNIIFAGRIPENELPAYIAGSHALVLVSHFEGFGIPLVEAMASGVPVIASNNSAMPEIVGSGGLLVNAGSIDEIAHALYTITTKKILYEQLKQNTLLEAKRFSWQHSTEKMYETIKKTLNL